jgi:O-antigen/teichoic acid export membrane protein
MKSKIISATFINIISLACSFIISFVLTPIILNRIGQEQYGIWVFLSIFAASGYFSILDMGMQNSAIKYIAQYHASGDKEELKHTINSVLLFFICMGIIAGVILFVFNYFFLSMLFNVPKQYLETVRMLVNLIALSFLFQFPAMGFSAVVEGLQRYDILRGVTIICSLLNMVLIIYFLTSENGIVFLTVVSLLTSLAIALLYLAATTLIAGHRINLLHVRISSFKNLFAMGWKLILSRIAGLIFNSTQKIIIAMMLTMSIMTQFDIISRVYMIVASIMSLMNGALIPFASDLQAVNDEERIRLLFLKATKYAVIITMPALVFFMSFSREFISIWIGTSYSDLAPLTMFLLSHCFLTVLTGVGGTMMVGMNRVEELLKVAVFAALLNIIISVMAAKSFGLSGLVAATVISYAIAHAIYIWMFKQIFKIRLLAFLKEVVFLSYGLGVLLWIAIVFIKQQFVFVNLIELFCFAICLYAVFFMLYLAVDGKERKVLLARIKRSQSV